MKSNIAPPTTLSTERHGTFVASAQHLDLARQAYRGWTHEQLLDQLRLVASERLPGDLSDLSAEELLIVLASVHGHMLFEEWASWGRDVQVEPRRRVKWRR